MSLRLEMLQVARLAPNLLREAGPRVAEFFRSQINDDGGGKDRAGASDLYYTVFVLEGLLALQEEPPAKRILPYLASFCDGADLDFVHLACLARCWASMPKGAREPGTADGILRRIEAHRSADGGYHAAADATTGTPYHCFLALGAYQDLGLAVPDRAGLVRCVHAHRSADGGYGNGAGGRCGLTTVTAAAVTLLRHLDEPPDSAAADWLLARGHRDGGFVAAPGVPAPDLLSTATALHALSGMHVSFDPLKEKCLDFLDTLWTGEAFCGQWSDDAVDAEYSYYALLSLGHLSL